MSGVEREVEVTTAVEFTDLVLTVPDVGMDPDLQEDVGRPGKRG